MKKSLLLIVLLFSVLIAKSDNVQKVEWDDVSNTNKGGRSLAITPEGWYNCTTNVLEIQFRSDDLYTLEVIDSDGVIVFQSAFATNGTKNIYILPQSTYQSYTFRLVGTSKVLEGNVSNLSSI